MRLIGRQLNVKTINLIGDDFIGDNIGTTKFSFRLAPSIKNTSCAFQVLCAFDSDCGNGNSIEYESHVLNIFDNGGSRPVLMQLVILAEESAKLINEHFNAEVVAKVANLPKDRILLEINDEAVTMIAKDLDEVYPIKR